MSKQIDTKTISGLVDILTENIKSLDADGSEANIKKVNAILQNVNGIKGIYQMGYSKERMEFINPKMIVTAGLDITQEDVLGDVVGDPERYLKKKQDEK